jgi:hypothetical protein
MASDETTPDATREGPGGTPEGHTPERPAPDEFGKPGTPAAGLSPETPHRAEARDAGHAHQDAHGDDHSGDHSEEPLGPPDWGAWAASLVGMGAGALVALAMVVAVARG